MEPDLDDTVRAAPRPSAAPRPVDFDDTVVRGGFSAPAAQQASEVPPALVEPPAPERRPIRVVEPEPVEPALVEPAPVEPARVETALAEAAGDAEPQSEFRVVLADGTEVPLDVTVYLGRKPSIPRIHSGPPPRLVTLRSPGKELSATHLELKVVGGAVVASDMRSTNGTVVQLPGAAPRTLIRGESAVVVPGTRIDLGEGVVLDILPPRERSGR